MADSQPTAIRCPICGGNHRQMVTDSRGVVTGDAIRRRRRCSACGARFTTYERVESGAEAGTRGREIISIGEAAADIVRRLRALIGEQPAGEEGDQGR